MTQGSVTAGLTQEIVEMENGMFIVLYIYIPDDFTPQFKTVGNESLGNFLPKQYTAL